MYKLFLCLRYLRSRVIAFFAMIAVALCVAMMLIVISVMNGFLHKIELAAKGLFGDVVIESTSSRGIGEYDEFIAQIKREVPEIEDASPFIITYGLLQTGNTSQGVQVAGIRMPERTRVSSFGDGLYFQGGLPQNAMGFDPDFRLLADRMKDVQSYTQRVAREIRDEANGKPTDEQLALLEDIDWAGKYQADSENVLRNAADKQEHIRNLQHKIDHPGKLTQEQVDDLREELNDLCDSLHIQPPPNRAIMGLGVGGFMFRTPKGQIVRVRGPGSTIGITLLPTGMPTAGTTDLKPDLTYFTIVDDCRTDVAGIDSSIVYVPFETLQQINNMGPRYSAEDPSKVVIPARCGQIHVKVRKGHEDNAELERIAGKVSGLWYRFEQTHPLASSGASVTAQTWRQRQARLVNQIAAQRTLVVIMFAIISMVSVVLIFVIFYMIVFQKTKDIGVIKAVGGSSGGVAQIFLAYGGAVGLVGSVVGSIVGYIFVLNINPIHDWVGRVFGLVIWNREWFMFEKIPNEVEPTTIALVVLGAIVSGIIGALLPAVLAARMEPVEALRYE